MNVTGWTLVVDDDGELLGVEANVELELGDAPAGQYAPKGERTLFLEVYEGRLETAVECGSILRLGVVVDPTRVDVRRDGVDVELEELVRDDDPAVAELERAARDVLRLVSGRERRNLVNALEGLTLTRHERRAS